MEYVFENCFQSYIFPVLTSELDSVPRSSRNVAKGLKSPFTSIFQMDIDVIIFGRHQVHNIIQAFHGNLLNLAGLCLCDCLFTCLCAFVCLLLYRYMYGYDVVNVTVYILHALPFRCVLLRENSFILSSYKKLLKNVLCAYLLEFGT